MPFDDTNSAVLTFHHRPSKGDSVSVGGLKHTFRRTKLKRVGSELRKAMGTRYGVEERYAMKGRRKVLTLIISKAQHCWADMPTPFPPNKTAEELGIKLWDRLVMVSDKEGVFATGDRVVVAEHPRENILVRVYRESDGAEGWVYLSNAAYAEEPPWEEAYVPQIGDRICLEGVVDVRESGSVSVLFDGTIGPAGFSRTELSKAKLLPHPKRKVTQAEINERLGEEVEIISE
jgi:hypothetical protein